MEPLMVASTLYEPIDGPCVTIYYDSAVQVVHSAGATVLWRGNLYEAVYLA